MPKGVDATEAARAPSTAARRERAQWIARQVLPLEAELRRAIGRRAPHGLDIDDIIQEIYARLAATPSVDHILSPRAYVYRMAGGVISDYVRHQKVVPILSVENIDLTQGGSPEPSPETIAADRDELRQLDRFLKRLPKAVADVFWLRRIEGLSQREVSHRLGVSESTVEKRTAKGLYLLAQAVEAGGFGRVESTTSMSRKLRRAREPRDR